MRTSTGGPLNGGVGCNQAAALILAVLVLFVSHRSAAGISAEGQRQAFRAAVDLVTVDVVVTDSNDRPVTNLTAADFELLQDGTPQDVAQFFAVDVPVGDRQVETTPHEASVDVAANEPPHPSARQFVVVVDDLHLIETDITPVRRIVEELLEAMTAADEAAITFVGRSDLGVDFTNDLSRLRQPLANLREAIGFGLDARPHYLEVEGLSHARSSAWVLRNVVESLAASAYARRAVILISDGVNFDQTAAANSRERQQAEIAFEEIRRVYQDARRAGVPVYTIDPRGQASAELAVRGDAHAAGAGRQFVGVRSSAGTIGADDLVEIDRRIKLQQDYLAELAINTGGRHFINRSNLGDAVRELMRENGSYYLLGYYPSRYEPDGEWHRIEVRVKRPGLRVRAREGFVPRPAAPAEPAAMIEEALGSGVPRTGLPLRAAATTVDLNRDGATALVTLELLYPPGGERPAADTLAIGVLVLGPDGQVRASSRQDVEVPIGPDGSVVNYTVDVPRGSAVLRVAVASRAAGRVGSIHMPIDAEDAEANGSRLGRLAIGLVGAGAAPDPGAAASQVVPFQPTTERQFAPGDRLRLFARVFGVPQTAIAQTAAEVTLRRQDQDVRTAAASLTTSPSLNQADALGDLDLTGVEPGDYALGLSVTLPDGTTLTREVALQVR